MKFIKSIPASSRRERGGDKRTSENQSPRTEIPTTSIESAPALDRYRRPWIFVLVASLGVMYHILLRPWYRSWGATPEEINRYLPGDELLPEPSDETTRAITVAASHEDVWPWIVQLGQGRGGFYSYTWLENLTGADIHNTDRIVPGYQDLKVGDSIRMVREDYWLQSPITSMTVKRIDPGRTLVLQGHNGGTWTFHLEPIDNETTRFIVRGRNPKNRTIIGYTLRYLSYELPHFIMERRMMRGITSRAERSTHASSSAWIE